MAWPLHRTTPGGGLKGGAAGREGAEAAQAEGQREQWQGRLMKRSEKGGRSRLAPRTGQSGWRESG